MFHLCLRGWSVMASSPSSIMGKRISEAVVASNKATLWVCSDNSPRLKLEVPNNNAWYLHDSTLYGSPSDLAKARPEDRQRRRRRCQGYHVKSPSFLSGSSEGGSGATVRVPPFSDHPIGFPNIPGFSWLCASLHPSPCNSNHQHRSTNHRQCSVAD